MSRKHYAEMASIIWGKVKLGGDSVLLADIAIQMALYFESENPRFNRSKFFTACALPHLNESENVAERFAHNR